MPYVKKINRISLDDHTREPNDAGELNYMFTKMINSYIKRKGKNYARLNEVVGSLECCKLELYRRIIGPYEDTKITNPENGDVFTI